MTTDLGAPVTEPARRRGPIRFLFDFWVKPIRAEPLAAFRICLGLTLFFSTLESIVVNFDLYMGPDRLMPPSSIDPWIIKRNSWTLFRGPINIPYLETHLPDRYKEAWVNWAEDPRHTYWLLQLWMLASLCMAMGLYTRFSTILTWALTVSFHYRYSWFLNGGDQLVRCGLFYLMFAPAGKVWSLDAWLGRARNGANPTNGPVFIRPWTVRLLQIQLACVYFFTGIYKLGDDWYYGEAVYWVLKDITLTRFPYSWLPIPLFICRILTWATLVFEIGWPLFVVIPFLRPWLLVGGVLFHLGILFHTDIGWFSFISLAWYPLFLSGETFRRFLPGRSKDRKEAESTAAVT
jgi:hypothetical protein